MSEAPTITPLIQLEYLSTGVARMVEQLVRTVDDPIEQPVAAGGRTAVLRPTPWGAPTVAAVA